MAAYYTKDYWVSGYLPLSSFLKLPIAVVSRSTAWTVFTRWNAGIVGSNPTRSMDVRVRLFVFVLFCVYVAAFRQADPPSKGS
jgi:hypothetical protein